MKLNIEQVLPNEYARVLALRGVELDQEVINDVMKCPIHAFSKFLGLKKSRNDEGGTSLVLRDDKGNFIIAGTVEYHEPEIEDQAGNWSYEFKFDEKDVTGHQYVVNDASFMEVLANVGREHHLAITDMSFAFDLVVALFEALKNVLDENVTVAEEYEIESEGFFIATAKIEDGEKVFGLTPSGEMKRLIKDDSTLEG